MLQCSGRVWWQGKSSRAAQCRGGIGEKSPSKLCYSEYRHNAEGGLEKCPLPIYVAVEQILTHHPINNTLSKGLTHYPTTDACVTQPVHPEGAKDEVKRPEGPPVRSRGPEDPYTSSTNVNVNTNLNTMQRDGLEKSSNLYCSRMKLVKKLISFSGTKFQHIDKLFTSTFS